MSVGPYLSANGQRVTTADLAIPYLGAPVCDVTLAAGATLTDPVSLVLGNLTRAMSILRTPEGKPRMVSFAGITYARLVAGAGTWQTPITLPPYSNPGGIMLSKVLGDVARATGSTTATRERVTLAAGLDRSLGTLYAIEPATPATRLLAVLAGALWWVDVKGVTQIATTRPTSVITSKTDVDSYDGAMGILTVATEDVAAWTPGATYVSPTVPALAVRAVRIKSDAAGKLRVMAMVS